MIKKDTRNTNIWHLAEKNLRSVFKKAKNDFFDENLDPDVRYKAGSLLLDFGIGACLYQQQQQKKAHFNQGEAMYEIVN